jgi:hypothetical protein
LQYHTGDAYLPFYVFNNGTYNVYHATSDNNEARISVKIYGRQQVIIHCNPPYRIISDNPALIVEESSYDTSLGKLLLIASATDFQGVLGNIRMLY